MKTPQAFFAEMKKLILKFTWNFKIPYPGTSLAVQGLRHHASNAGGHGFNPWLGTKISHTMQSNQK